MEGENFVNIETTYCSNKILCIEKSLQSNYKKNV